jgi:hypothetical protein
LAVREQVVGHGGIKTPILFDDLQETDVSECVVHRMIGQLTGRIQIIPDALVQEEGVLWKSDESGAHFLPGNSREIHSIDDDRALLNVDES